MHNYTRVILTKNYIATPSFPVWGSKHQCLGTVKNFTLYRAKVEWDNGTEMTFRKDHLTVVNDYYDAVSRYGGGYKSPKSNPNQAFKERRRYS